MALIRLNRILTLQPAPRLHGYSRETVIAEKFEAMVKLGLVNSGMKDFYDIALLARQFDFDGPLLSSAITRTFANRKTSITPSPFALTPAFTADADKQKQWRAFVRKSRLDDTSAELQEVVDFLGQFLLPVAVAIADGHAFNQVWQAPGPWKK
jgi:hypothetical protein